MPFKFLIGLNAEKRSKVFLSCTLTEVNPSPIGVVQGPFSATSEYQKFKSGEDAFSGMNLDADEGGYVIEGQSN